MQNNVTACQKAQCVFHGMSREGDRTTLCTVKCSQVNWSVIKIRKKLPIAIGTMAYQARGIIKAFASVCVEGGGGGMKSFESSKFDS